LKTLLSNKAFLIICLALTFLYYVITGIQYWVSNYLITELRQDEKVVFISFAIISITGPVLGVVVGGNVTTQLGGYNSKRALQLCIVASLLCLASALPTPFVDSFPIFVALLWFLLFFGGAILPCMTGIMLSTVDT
jgi:sugar phosphate permease